VAVLNRDLHVQMWNRWAEDLWGLRADEAVGQHFLNLDIGLPTEQLRPMIRQLLADGTEPLATRIHAVNRRGRTIEVRAFCTALTRHDGDTSGVVLVMDPVDLAGADGSAIGGQALPEPAQGAGEQP
jgi:two-component system, chemotaxis family, CheB/CheR fusion protein